MCFNLMSKNYEGRNPLIAKKNIICYKSVSLNLTHGGELSIRSSIRNYEYTLGKLVEAEFDINRYHINAGLHSYKNIGKCNVKCIIPKGATYYENDSEYCSDQIKIVALTALGKMSVRDEINWKVRLSQNNIVDYKNSIVNYTNKLKKFPKLIKEEEVKLKKALAYKEKVTNNILKLR